MSVEIIEAATALGFGAADAAIAAKVTQKLPGNLSMSFGFELAGVLAGLYGQKVGVDKSMRDPILFAALGALGARASKLAMAGKLMQPSQWGVGGDGVSLGPSGGDMGYAAGGGAPLGVSSRLYGGARNAPGVRLIGRGGDGQGGSFGLYPQTSEAAGVAG